MELAIRSGMWDIGVRLLWARLCIFFEGLFSFAARRGNAAPVAAGAAREQTNVRAKEALERYGDAVLRMAYSYLHNMADAEDVLQDTLVQMLRTAPVFESTAHEKAWLLRVAINLSKNRLKREGRYRTEELDDELAERLPAGGQADLAFVWEEVKALPDDYREVVHLFYQEGYATGEIARMLGKNEATVRSLLYRARQRLKSTLREVYDFG